jgi:hypothetical protein
MASGRSAGYAFHHCRFDAQDLDVARRATAYGDITVELGSDDGEKPLVGSVPAWQQMFERARAEWPGTAPA